MKKTFAILAAWLIAASAAFAQNQEYDVFLLIGQSNMAGRGKILDSDRLPAEGVYVLDSLDRPVPAAAPLNQFSTIRKKLAMQGYNIGNSFAEDIHAKTGRKVLLVVNAKGGTAIEEWLKDAPSKTFSTKNGDEKAWDGKTQPQFYSEAIRRTKAAMQYGELKAILWHQGEANSSEAKAAKYLDQLHSLVEDLRKDLGAETVPFVACEINNSRKSTFNPVINAIGSRIHCAYCVKAEDCPMNSDNLHFSREGLVTLGHRYADIVYKVAYQGQDFGIGTIYHDGWIDFNKNGVKDIYEDPSADIDARIEDLLSQMNSDEKTAQMVTLYGYRRVLQDDLPTPEWKNKLWKDGMGAIDEHLNAFRNWGLPLTDNPYVWPASKHAWALNEVQRFFIEDTRLGIPTDFTNEGIRGVEAYMATNFPTQLGLGHTWDRELVNKVGYITGREGRLLGYTNVYAPILDVGRDQRWGRYEEVYGEDPYLVAELGVQMAKGMQTDYQVAATAKHFIAYSNNKGAREGMARVDPQMAPHEVENIHVYPWREVIRRAGILGVMSSYNDYDGYPVQGSSYWLMDRLRGDFGFKGYVVSDSDAVEYLHTKHHVSKDMKESVYQSVMAGLNIRCTFRTPDSYVLPLRELVKEGTIPMEIIDERVRDILRVKFLVGMFDHPYQMDYAAADREVNSAENNEYALRASRESVVLLKNDGTLPLDASKLKKVAVIGPNGDEVSFTHTHYGPLATKSVSVLEGLTKALNGKATVSYAKGCDLVDANWPVSEILPTAPTKEELKEIDAAVKLAKKSDVVILCLGGGMRTCGENKSRTSLELPGHQELLLEKICATGKPVVVVLLNGRPLSVNYADANASAILEAWYPGSHGGTAIAEILLGDYNPSGKLTVTFPKTVGQIPFNFPYKPNSQVDGTTKPGLEGNQSRVNGALYNFGYGLSYTTFKYSDLKISKKIISPEESTQVSFTITNTGSRKGDEVVQLYLHDKVSSITRYEKLLRGFERVSLEAGESKTITMTIGPKDLALLDENFNSVVEPGEFDVMVAASSTDIRLKGKIIVNDGSLDASVLYPDDASSKKASFPAKLGVSEDVTMPLKEGKLIDYLDIVWGEGTDCEFEILWTKGGGQFLPCFKGTAKGAGKSHCKFEGLEASEIRIGITKGKAVVNSMTSFAIDLTKE